MLENCICQYLFSAATSGTYIEKNQQNIFLKNGESLSRRLSNRWWGRSCCVGGEGGPPSKVERREEKGESRGPTTSIHPPLLLLHSPISNPPPRFLREGGGTPYNTTFHLVFFIPSKGKVFIQHGMTSTQPNSAKKVCSFVAL